MSKVIEEQLRVRAEADAVCAADPVQAAVRDELLHIEGHGTESAYEVRDITNTHVYQMSINPTTGEAKSAPLRILTEVVRYFAMNLQQPIPQVMDVVTLVLANPELGPNSPSIGVSIRAAINEYQLPDGWELYGVGVVSTAHSLRADAVDGKDLTADDISEDNPDLRACWYTHLVGRDSRVWTVMHQQGYDVVYGTSGPDEPAEGVPELESLTRLVNLATRA